MNVYAESQLVHELLQERDFLMHHGILGQKWGVRRFQNKDGTRTKIGKEHVKQQRAYKAEKAGKKKDGEREGSNALSYFDNTFKTLGTMFEIEPFYASDYKRNSKEYYDALREHRKNITEAKEALIKNAEFTKNNSGKYLDAENNKRDLITKYVEKHDAGDRHKIFLDTSTLLGKKGEVKIDEESINRFAEETNPLYNYGAGWNNNCPKCSAIMTLKKMGYSEKLTAAPLSDGASSTHGISQWFNGATTETVGTIDNLEKSIKSGGIGSFGAIGGSRYATDSEGNTVRTGGHSMAYTVMKDGNIQVECGQSGKIYHSLKEAATDQGFSFDKGFTFTRLDNTTPNFTNMSSDSVISSKHYSDSDDERHRMDSTSRIINTQTGETYDPRRVYGQRYAGNHSFFNA